MSSKMGGERLYCREPFFVCCPRRLFLEEDDDDDDARQRDWI